MSDSVRDEQSYVNYASVSNDESSINNDRWLENIGNNSDYWVSYDDINEYPSIIAFEYDRLRRLCLEGDAYGAMHCLKDNFEAILKLEVLIAFAWADRNMNEDFRRKTVSLITTQNLSFGSWMALGERLVKDLPYDSLPLGIPLMKLLRYYSRNKIVNWRNESLGHGFLRFRADEQFKKEIIEVISVLKGVFINCDKKSDVLGIDDELKHQMLYACTEDGYVKRLNGVKKGVARGIEKKGDVVVCFEGESIEDALRLSPFIYIGDKNGEGYGLYFFENQKRNSLSVFQAYAEGRRDSRWDGYFERLRRYLIQNGASLDSAADDPIKSDEDNKVLDASLADDEYLLQQHLIKWIRQCIGNGNDEKKKKGIYLLNMARGMGKSVFTERLNSLVEGANIVYSDVTVRTYHMNRVQISGEDDFESYIETLWSHSKNFDTHFSGLKTINEFIKDGKSKPKAVLEYLKQALRAWKTRGDGIQRLLMIFDGLDEVVSYNIWDYLPDEDDIEGEEYEGIYILYTSRDPDKDGCKSFFANDIRGFKCNERKSVELSSKENLDFLKSYISKMTRGRTICDADIKRIVDSSHNRILELGILCRLYLFNEDIEYICNAESFVKKYLTFINRRYGDADYNRIIELLLILATLGEMTALSIKAIGEISGENKVSIRLVGMMHDISSLLNIERSYEGNLYRLANPDVAACIVKEIPDNNRNDVIQGLVNLAVASMIDMDISDTYGYGGEEILCSKVVELSMLLPKGTEALGEKRFDLFEPYLEAVKTKISFGSPSRYYKTRVYTTYGNARYQHYLLNKQELSEEDPKTLESEHNYAITLSKMMPKINSFGDIDNYWNDVCYKRKTVLGEKHEDTLLSMIEYAKWLDKRGYHKKAEKIFRKVLLFYIDIFGNDGFKTLECRWFLGESYRMQNKKKKAMREFEQIYKQGRRLLGKKTDKPLIKKAIRYFKKRNGGIHKPFNKLPEFICYYYIGYLLGKVKKKQEK